MERVVNVYTEGEGYIVYLLLKGLVSDHLYEVCLRYKDRPLFPEKGLNFAIVPKLGKFERDIFRLLGDRVWVISSDCGDLKNCTPVDGEFVISALREVISAVLGEEAKELVHFLENYSFDPSEVKVDEETLLEKLSFYLPLAVGKRESVVQAWKYYLELAGVPTTAFMYPRDRELIERVVHNATFQDKVFPLLLGRLPEGLVESIKRVGFVPYRVEIEGKSSLDSELKLILTAKELAKKVKRPV